jgi:hypothetical protein
MMVAITALLAAQCAGVDQDVNSCGVGQGLCSVARLPRFEDHRPSGHPPAEPALARARAMVKHFGMHCRS